MTKKTPNMSSFDKLFYAETELQNKPKIANHQFDTNIFFHPSLRCLFVACTKLYMGGPIKKWSHKEVSNFAI